MPRQRDIRIFGEGKKVIRKRVKWFLLATLTYLLICYVSALAMPPKPGLFEPDARTGLSRLTGRPIVRPRISEELNRPEPFKIQLVTGTNNILLIVIDYPDLAATQIVASFADMVNGPWASGSLNDYYQEISYGNFGLSGVNAGWYAAANNHNYYANFDGIWGTSDDFGTGAYPHNAPKLVEEAVDAAEAAGVDFSNYDNDGDGWADTVFIVHAGRGAEATNDPDDIWSHKWDIFSGGGIPRYYDGVWINTYSIQPELNSTGGHIEIGVFAHEYGHVLGLPDLYDTDGTSEGIGNYGLMAGGGWGADGSSPERPSHMCAWSKVYLGWINSTVVTVNILNQATDQIETNAEVYKLWKNGIPGEEYFLVSNRQKVGFDSRFVGDGGLLVWHIDENVINANLSSNTVNNDENHKGVDLEEADGLNDLDYGRNRGDAGDFYPGSTNNTTFNDTSNPNSRAYSGDSTSVEVGNISSSQGTMSADLLVGVSGDTTPPDTFLLSYPGSKVTGNALTVEATFLWTGSDNITSASNLVYSYSLEDYESGWSPWSSGTSKTYTLPMGNYVFKVKARDEAGNIDATPAEWTFQVSLPVIAYPNPCYPLQGQVVRIANLPLDSNMKVRIYNMAGELVRTLEVGNGITLGTGSATALWNCKNDSQQDVARGIYPYFIFSIDEGKGVGKIVLIR